MRAYKDPTSDAAINTLVAEETRLAMVIQIIKLVVKLGGFRLTRRVEVEDVISKRRYL